MKKIFSKGIALLMSGVMMLGGMGIMPAFAEESIAAGAECEALYAEWQGSGSYAAYYKADGGAYIKVDSALIRNDGNGGYRAEVLGLKGGVNYTVKVVPVVNGAEDEASAFTFEGVPESYDRSGYAHFNTTNSPGAYLADGTLPTNADVVYVNESNKNTVTLGKRKGLADIISGYNKGTTPLVVRFIGQVTAPSGLNSEKMLNIKGTAGLTIEGIGTDSGVYGWGFSVSDASDMEFRNLHIDWNYEDGIGIQKASRVWIHDNTFTVGNQNPPTEADKKHGDGSCDAKTSDYVTISYNHFKGTAKTCLLGSNASKRETTGHYTYHHNFFDGTEQRTPRVRWHNVHVYNNYYKNAGYDLDDGSKIGYGIAATCNASIFAENNYFENTYRPLLTSDKNCSALSKNDGGVIKAFGNYFDENCSGMEEKDYFPATDKYQVLTAADYTASLGGWTYDNFDTSSSFYRDDYFLESAQDCVDTVLKYAGTENKTALTLTNAINGDETGSGDSIETTTQKSAAESTTKSDESTETTTSNGTESTTKADESTETTTEYGEYTTVDDNLLQDTYGYYFYDYDHTGGSTPLTFGTIFTADKEMNISTLSSSIVQIINETAYTYSFRGVAGFGNKAAIKFTAEKPGRLRIVSTSGSTTARKMDITNSSGSKAAQLTSGKSGQAELAEVQLDAGSYTITNNGGGEAKLFYIGFTPDSGTIEKPDEPVKEVLYGKAFLDDEGVTANDSAAVLQYALDSASIETDSEFEKRCDVDGINGINANDAAYIMQKALVSTFVLPVEEK